MRHARCATILSLLLELGCSSDRKPDIVLVVVDTLRADHLEAYGYGGETAPNLSRLAARGLLYERVVAASSWTKTSMASIWTSRNALRHGVMRESSVLPDDLSTLAASLRESGYQTVGVHTNPWLKERYGFSRGFDVYESLLVRKGFVGASRVTDRAVTLAQAASPRRPLFLYVHYMDVHPPYGSSIESPLAPLEVDPLGLIDDRKLDYLYRKKNLDGPGVQQRILDLYDSDIRAADTSIRDLLSRLDASRRGGDRIVVVTSDHGEAFREHGTTEHGRNIYPEVYSVPLILVAPNRLAPGVRIATQVRSIDIAPTVLDLARARAPETFDGASLPLRAGGGGGDRIAVSAVGYGAYVSDAFYVGVVSATHLFIRERLTDTAEFFALRDDPGARDDLGAAHPEAADYAAIERALLLRETEMHDLDPEDVEALRSLGYLQ